MPRYTVLSKGFFDGVLYSPEKRSVLHTDKGFPMKGKTEQVPSWLERIKDETAAQRKARLAKETKAKAADAEKAKEDAEDIAAVSFIEPSSGVEDL